MVKKIAVLRANAIEDFIFVLPALQALREKYHSAEIVYLGREWHKEYLQNRPGPVDRVIVVPLYPGISEVEECVPDESVLKLFFDEMQKEEFDIALQLHGGGKNSNPFLLRLGAKLTAGIKTPDADALDISVPYVHSSNETMQYLEVVSRLGAKTRFIEPNLSVTENDIAEAYHVLGNTGTHPVALIHPGGSDLRRRWPPEGFAAIADHLAESGFQVYVTGLDCERPVIDLVMSKIENKNKVQDLIGQLSLAGMTGLTSLAKIVVSNDTGPLHVARAVNTPSVGIFWCADKINAQPITAILHRSLLSWTVHCPLCGLSSFEFEETEAECKHDTSFVAEIPVEEVKDAIEELLSQNSKLKQPFYATALA